VASGDGLPRDAPARVDDVTERGGATGGRTAGAASGRRLLTTLLAFTPDRPAPTVADLSADVGVPASTMYRYLSLLRETGLVEASGDGTYRLTDRVLGMALAAEAGRTDLLTAGHAHVVGLRDDIEETVLLARRGGDYAYCVDRAESPHPVRLQFHPGQAMPLHSGSAARVLLAAMPVHERESYLRRFASDLPQARLGLVSDERLAQVTAAGWTESFEEVDEGIWGVAAAIVRDGEVVAALGTAGPIYRLDEQTRESVVTRVRAAAAAISKALAQS
jgi:DNA-binding IclR family transcriptional regulator